MNKRFLMASLILGACAAVPDHERASREASLTDQYDDCWVGELYTCNDYRMVLGYNAILEKVGKDAELLKAEHGDLERGLIALGCGDQAPGVFAAVLRPGDTARDYWCSRKVAERLKGARADKRK